MSQDDAKGEFPQQQEVVSRKELFRTPFLQLVEIEYTRPPFDRLRKWQMAERPRAKPREPGSADAVCVFCIVKKKGEGSKLVVVKQFRPPLGKFTVELPAGLIDEGESFQEAALRELKEETGYSGRIVGSSGVQYLSPGLTNECVRTVTVEVDGDIVQNADTFVQSASDATFIKCDLLPLKGLTKALQGLEADGYGVKAMLYSFAQGLEMQEALASDQ
eukprot:CAMPEP_0114290952 /NCGR_PEP_ID=MMETSP0059-20121206/8222_1 /TAXON_ID=36894 /ORGANISM="Pyramimonas parkeae, Strain CCMP726" /LENGTH=217 /DNA_ID=CAMNT_0001412407 /DNA_START=50 /DNA_END=703 /DNA_ORIENTATION=+